MKILRILWNDASVDTGYMMDEDDVKKYLDTDYLIDTVGHLIGISDKAVILATDHHLPNVKFRYSTRIPKEYVREVELLKDDPQETGDVLWLSSFLSGSGVRPDGRDGGERSDDRSGGIRGGRGEGGPTPGGEGGIDIQSNALQDGGPPGSAEAAPA